MKKSIKIERSSKSSMGELKTILKNVEQGKNYYWKILWVEGAGQPSKMTILELERRVNKSEGGLSISWNGLWELFDELEQITEFLLIGDVHESNLKRYENDADMHEGCSYSIELVDSSYWEITSDDQNFINKLSL